MSTPDITKLPGFRTDMTAHERVELVQKATRPNCDGMIGTERTVTREENGQTVTLTYRVEGVRYRPARRFNRAGYVVWGYCIDGPERPGQGLTYTWIGAHCSEFFPA